MLWPNAFSVGRPCTRREIPSRTPFIDCWRAWPGRSRAREHARREQRHQGGDQHDRGDRHVPPDDKDKDRQRGQHRDRDLRHILAKKALQLLDAVDHRQHDAAGALAGEPGRAQRGDLVVEPAAQLLLHPRGVLVGDDGAGMVDQRRAAAPRRDAGRQQRDRVKKPAPLKTRASSTPRSAKRAMPKTGGQRGPAGSPARSSRAARGSAPKGVGQNTSADLFF